jgi:hypothetical protein
MSDTKTLKKEIEKLLRSLDARLEEYIATAVKLGHEIGRDDLLSKRKVMDAVRLEVIRGLPAAKLELYGSVKRSTRKLPG